jgi:protein phosphatase
MKRTIEAACGCHIGKVRKNNEDNFYFDGKCLELENEGLKHPAILESPLKTGLCLAVFDGMGGENFGEHAAFAAARQLQQCQRNLADFLVSEKKYLQRLTQQLNDAVVSAQQELSTERMGTTMVSLYFSGRYVYVCNVGDSRAYRLRDGEFLQLSADHVRLLPGQEHRKAPLSQYLGIDPEEFLVEPYIARGDVQPGDIYLLCSDGLTDMLTNFEISDILLLNENSENQVQMLIDAALRQGGRDNITAIVCRIQ